MSDYSLKPQTRRWLDWEWRAALITILGGVVLVAAVAGYFQYRAYSQRQQATQTFTKHAAAIEMAALLCKEALISAKSFGVVPNYAVLTNPLPSATQVTGRYLCGGGTDVSKYNIAVDLVCRDLKSGHCLALYAVTQADGTILYRRHS